MQKFYDDDDGNPAGEMQVGADPEPLYLYSSSYLFWRNDAY